MSPNFEAPGELLFRRTTVASLSPPDCHHARPDEFLDAVKTGDNINISEDGTVEVG